jgi:hypothetical protein
MTQTETQGNNQVEHVEVEAVEVNALEVMERAAVDVQITTAHRYPLHTSPCDIDKFIEKAKKMVSVDEETAASCIYRRPVGKDDDSKGQKYVEGESIRLAEIVAACYGNLRIGVIISEMNQRYVKALGYAHDLESNVACKAEVVESTVTKWGKPYSERMRLVVAKAAQSKARRDAIFSVVPKSICKPIIEKARQIILGNQKPLEQRREAVKIWLSKLAIEPVRVFAALNIDGIPDLGDDELETLTGIRTALKDGEITLDEAFPPLNFKEKEEDTQKTIQQESGSEKINDPFGTGQVPAETQAKIDKQKAALDAAENQKQKPSRKPKAEPKDKDAKPKYTCPKCGKKFDVPNATDPVKGVQCKSLHWFKDPNDTPEESPESEAKETNDGAPEWPPEDE